LPELFVKADFEQIHITLSSIQHTRSMRRYGKLTTRITVRETGVYTSSKKLHENLADMVDLS